MKKEETALVLARAKADFEVIEIDDKDLEVVVGGFSQPNREFSKTNGNCGCAAGSTVTGTFDNGNCGCG